MPWPHRLNPISRRLQADIQQLRADFAKITTDMRNFASNGVARRQRQGAGIGREDVGRGQAPSAAGRPGDRGAAVRLGAGGVLDRACSRHAAQRAPRLSAVMRPPATRLGLAAAAGIACSDRLRDRDWLLSARRCSCCSRPRGLRPPAAAAIAGVGRAGARSPCSVSSRRHAAPPSRRAALPAARDRTASPMRSPPISARSPRSRSSMRHASTPTARWAQPSPPASRSAPFPNCARRYGLLRTSSWYLNGSARCRSGC